MASGGDGAAPSQQQNESIDAAGSASKAKPSTESVADKKARKRTKTGCLTCRKRRIKCGEERPICNNCIKSKRHCEGYNQRVIFKPPIGDWPAAQGNLSNTIPYHTGVIPGAPGARAVYQQPFPSGPSTAAPLTTAQGAQTVRFQFSGPGYGQYTPGPNPLGAVAFPSAEFSQDGSPYIVQQPQFGQPQAEPTYGARTYSVPTVPTTFAAQMTFPADSGVQAQRTQSVHLPYYPSTTVSQEKLSYPQPPTTQSYVQSQHDYQRSQSLSGPQFPPQPGTSHPFGNAGALLQNRDVLQHADQDVLVWHKIASGLVSDYQAQQQQFQEGQQQQFQETQQQPRQPDVASEAESSVAQPMTEEPQPTPQPQAQVPFDGLLQRSGYAEDHVSPTEVLQDAAVEYEDDDYWDVQSDDEMELVPQQQLMQGDSQPFDMMMQIHRDSVNDLSVRTYGAFLHPGILDNYRAEQVANPLRNPKTARVFAHFIHATGPSLSIYERNPRNASAMFTDGPVHPSQQSLWTYTLPMMALNHQGLLHAMLALSSLHIAKLQGASVTPSFKHYAYALKRVHYCVGHAKKRHQVTTLAAALLLGFYEVMTADHVKWSSHLLGAKQLFVEIDYAGMTKAWRKRKAEEEAFERNFAYENPGVTMYPPRLYKDGNTGPDERLISMFIGRKLRYGEFGKVEEEEDEATKGSGTIQDLSHYEIYQDLWWWYARHDAFQSIISGNRLLMDYSRWSGCPPRGPLGKPDAVHGSHDHLLLILGRIADFAARDRERKVKQVEANGGVWKPAPGMQLGPPRPPMGGGPPQGPASGALSMMGGPPGYGQQMQPPGTSTTGQYPQGAAQHPGMGLPPRAMNAPRSGMPMGGPTPGYNMAAPQGQPGQPPQRPPQPPPQVSFYGMAPAPSKNYMPSAFAKNKAPSPEVSNSGSASQAPYDLAHETQKALEEWAGIQQALTTFASHLGPGFQPLPVEFAPPLQTPFGPTLQYRSFDIAVLWALTHMCRIILARSHPHMPPASMVAAGVAAPQTASSAQEIGRITAGVMDGVAGGQARDKPLNPSVGAALIESVMPLFFAGIQYTDAAQRAWLVSRVKDVEARTGWASAGLVANGCQKAWEKAGEMGRGPPYRYERPEGSPDERISGRRRQWQQEREERGVRLGESEADAEGRGDMTDRRLIWTNPGTRVHWALGILGAEEDVIRPAEG